MTRTSLGEGHSTDIRGTVGKSMLHDALRYHDAGFKLVKLEPKDKTPIIKGWQKKEYSRAEVQREFSNGANIGIRCGDSGLVDVDVDDPLARRLAAHFLPSTGMVHGRDGAPASHHWYVVDPVPPKRLVWEDPLIKDKTNEEKAELAARGIKAMFVEIRSTGGQTMVPPSIHPDTDKPLHWETPTLDPTPLPTPILQQAVARLAACSLLARYWPGEGVRHSAALALGSVLLRYVYPESEDEAAEFVYLAATLGGDEEADGDRVRAVRDTRNTLIRGGHATGLPTLKRYFPEPVIQKFCEWLNIEGWDDPKASRLIFQVQDIPPADVEDEEWRAIIDEIDVPVVSPAILHRIVQHVTPLTNMFSPDWPIFMALGYWSSLFPGVRIQNLGLNLWVLGIAEQGSGKNVGTDELDMLFRPLRTEREVMHFTSGTPQGLWHRLDGEGKAILCYHDEYAGFLKSMNTEHTANMREALCSLYDGRGVSHTLAKDSVEVIRPHVSVVATTTLAAMQEFSRGEDLANGYFTRFMVYANDYRRVTSELRAQSEDVRNALAADLLRHLERLRPIERIEFASTGPKDPPTLVEYEAHLGGNSGEIRRFEDQAGQDFIPPGRLLARVKKVAALYELAEAFPNIAPDGRTVLVRDEHVETAIDLIQRSHAYTLRLWAQIGVPSDTRMVEHIRRHLRRSPSGCTVRDISQSKSGKKWSVNEVTRLLDMLVRNQEVTRTTNDRNHVVYRLV